MKTIFITIILLSLTSCAGVREIENYHSADSTNLPALVIASRHFSPYGASIITGVDDKKKTLTNSTHGGNMAVRVSEGPHLIDIHYSNQGSDVGYTTAKIERIPLDAKSGHVYEAKYAEKKIDNQSVVTASFIDLGYDAVFVKQKVIE